MTVIYQVEAGVATIILNRPERLNAVTAQMADDYADFLHRADADPAVRAIVVTGAGRGFCAGADLDLLATIPGDQAATPDRPAAGRGSGLRPDLPLRLRKPVIAAVNGPAAGVGFVMMLAADIRFVAEDAKLTTSFARLGLVAEYGSAYLLTRLVGVERALDLLMSGRRITGAEAGRMGLASRVLPAAEVLPTAVEYARTLARECSPRSLAVIKRQVYADLDRPFGEAVEGAVAAMRESFGWPDLREGLQAQAERRSPRFDPLEPDRAAQP
jgi:enoyl-CoA hydratase/carnithine racemase